MGKKYLIEGIEFDSDDIRVQFENAFRYIGSFFLNENDDELEGLIFEEFDDYSVGALLEFKLDILLESGLINEEIKLKAQEVRSLSQKVLNDKAERTASFIRTSPEWARIILLADEIRVFLNKNN